VRSRSSEEFWLPGPVVAQSERPMREVVGTQLCAAAVGDEKGPGWRAVGHPFAQPLTIKTDRRLTNSAFDIERPEAAECRRCQA
jgi:hypothetical protein